MKRRYLLASTVSPALLMGCLYDRVFELEWDEEVQLLDGRVIVVHIKRSYLRIEQGISRYGGVIRGLDGTLSFETGGSVGRVTQLFKGFYPIFLDNYEGNWYAVIIGGYYPKSREQPGQDWGNYEGPGGRAVKLVEQKFVPISKLDLPAPFVKPNMLLYGEAKEHAEFAGKRVTLVDKAQWYVEHPPGPGDVSLERPPEPKKHQPNLVPTSKTGELK